MLGVITSKNLDCYLLATPVSGIHPTKAPHT